MRGLSWRDYEPRVDAVSETFGLSGSSISRRFERASGQKLAELAGRDPSACDIVAIFLDGKTFGGHAGDHMFSAVVISCRLWFNRASATKRAARGVSSRASSGCRRQFHPQRFSPCLVAMDWKLTSTSQLAPDGQAFVTRIYRL